jgi:hypothetical protein
MTWWWPPIPALWVYSDSIGALIYLFISGICGVSSAASGDLVCNLPERYNDDCVETRTVDLNPVLTGATAAQLSGR